MRYLLAIFLPPIGLLLAGKPFQALLCIPVWILWPLASLWAVLVVMQTDAERRHRELLKAQQQRPPVNIYQR
jgi:uncharacterized membrane protein YqaE (UPF0057 family)